MMWQDAPTARGRLVLRAKQDPAELIFGVACIVVAVAWWLIG